MLFSYLYPYGFQVGKTDIRPFVIFRRVYLRETSLFNIRLPMLPFVIDTAQYAVACRERQNRSQHDHVSKDDEIMFSHRPVLLRSEEHTSELQSRQYLVCRLLLEKKINLL